MFKNRYKDFTVGQIEAALNKITDAGGIPALLRGDLEIKPRYLPFHLNEHGHRIIKVTARDLTGAEEIELLTALGFCIGDYAKQCLLSTNPDSYDALHRLEDGKVYKVALVPGKEVGAKYCTTENLKTQAESYGYGKPLAGLIPRIRESVTDKQMEQMGIRYIAGLHDPIKDSRGDPDVLGSRYCSDGLSLDCCWVSPDYVWDDDGAFAFVVPDPEG